MPETAEEAPRVIAVPSDRLWLDPPFINRQLFTQISTVTWGGPGTRLVAKVNRMRWAIGFQNPPTGGVAQLVGAWSDVNGAAGITINDAVLLWFEIGKYGSLVGDAWYSSAAGVGGIRVYEVIRLM